MLVTRRLGRREGDELPVAPFDRGSLGRAMAEFARTLDAQGADPFVTLFSESSGRVLVAVPRTEETRFTGMCTARGLPWTRIGVVDEGSDSIEVQGQFSVPMAELRETFEGTLPRLFG